MFALADKLGKQTAHDVVYHAAMRSVEQGVTFETTLMQNSDVKGALDGAELRALFDPTTYVGLAPEIVERVLAEVRASGWLDAK
jgi:adenylosuccinate lyase